MIVFKKAVIATSLSLLLFILALSVAPTAAQTPSSTCMYCKRADTTATLF